MRITLADKFIAYLALLSGISLSVVAEYYSILGLMAIFSAAPLSVVVMGIALGVGKITATVWLKQNWKVAPWTIRAYLLSAIAVLMLITSMGIFGFLSKAHSDQSLVSGDVQSRIAVYDEQIKTAKENIDANRKALKQMDEAVDQVMARSSSETGADKAVALRRTQQRERARLQSEIKTEQAKISRIGEERAPIAAEVRKVEAEVGPIKYIAAFVYGETNEGLLEKAVTWVIIILIVVFDPLAVTLLLASQYSFQWFRQARNETETSRKSISDVVPQPQTLVVDTPDSPITKEIVPEEKSILEQHPYLNQPFAHFKDLQPMVYKPEVAAKVDVPPVTSDDTVSLVVNEIPSEKETVAVTAEEIIDEGLNHNTVANLHNSYPENPERGQRTVITVLGHPRNMIFNGQNWVNADESNPEAIHALDEEAKKKSSYMIKQDDQQVVKTKK